MPSLLPRANPATTHFAIRENITHGRYSKQTAPYIQTYFKTDLERVFKLERHPKAGAVYALAWEYGHALGLFSVLGYYNDLAGLVR